MDDPKEPAADIVRMPEDVFYSYVTMEGLYAHRRDLVQGILSAEAKTRIAAQLEKKNQKIEANIGGIGVLVNANVGQPATAQPQHLYVPNPDQQKEWAKKDFLNYLKKSAGIAAVDPTTVTKQRLNNMKKKYIDALVAWNFKMPPGVTVNFILQGTQIKPTWVGTKPTNLPPGLELNF